MLHDDFHRWSVRYWRIALAGCFTYWAGILVYLLGTLGHDWHTELAGACLMVGGGTYLAARTTRVAFNTLSDLKRKDGRL